MYKGFTYFWLIMFACSLNGAFAMNPDLPIKSETAQLTEMSCCCDHGKDEKCAKSCCTDDQKSSDEKDCMGHCGNSSNHCSSISITIIVPPNENLMAISELIEYTFGTLGFSYLESFPQPIALSIWQPPQIG